MGVSLRDYQKKAINNMKNGCILCGGVGSGKSLTAIGYYYLQNGGDPDFLEGSDVYIPMDDVGIKDLYIVTTARKRDTLEWEGELLPFLLSPINNDTKLYSNKVVVDSWNNIKKYENIDNAFFIFDEQRVVGSGAWVEAFLKIARNNKWILLSATPGDTWSDYIPVFIANGFYKNKTEFVREHVVFSRFTKYPKVDRFLNVERLVRLRNKVLVNMDFDRKTVSHNEDVYCNFNATLYRTIMSDRWNVLEDKPLKTASELCGALRRLVNSDESRQVALLEIIEKHPKAIIFYNFNYELEILKTLFEPLSKNNVFEYSEWNGFKHQEIPKTESWVYFVQYTAGAEGWNCIRTDTIIFYSQNYSYKVMEQARGRIDRLNTPYTDLYYYHLKSHSKIDMAINRALTLKKKFNEAGWIKNNK